MPKRCGDEENVLSEGKRPKTEAESPTKETVIESADPKLTEIDVGITEYVGNHKPFWGIIKQRFSDFVVHEIDKQGSVIRLNDLTEPKDEPFILPEVEQVFEAETRRELSELSEGNRTDRVRINVSGKSKDERRIMHSSVASSFPGLNSETEDSEGEKWVVVTKANDQSKNRRTFGVRQNWPTSRGNYTRFVMYKENIDTMEGVNLIARMMGMKAGALTYAGVKDRRGKTSQQLTLYRTEARKLLDLNKRLRGVVLGNVKYVKEALKLGDLWGNRFNIILRNVNGSEEDIRSAITSLEQKGFLNYYGMQRFGTTTVPTYKVGLALLKADWSTAIELIMQPRPGEDENTSQCRVMWKEGADPKRILNLLKRQNSVEAHLLRGLAKHGSRDYVNTLNSIPRNVRLIYVHSYQSYIWNRVVSARFRLTGTEVVDGDLHMEQIDEEGLEGEEPSQEKERVIPTYVEDKAKVPIEQVVLPLFGHDVIYPKNQIADLYREYLSADGLDIDDLKRKVKDYSLPGSYRHILIRPKCVEWSLMSYSDPTVALINSDWDIMQKQPSVETSEGELKALRIQFDLPRSCYATMALRDLMHLDTSANHQKSLNT